MVDQLRDQQATLVPIEDRGAREEDFAVISFEGQSVEELREAFAGAVDEYLAFCEEEGVAPDKPFSGNVALRMSPDLHRAATVSAQTEGKSLNAWLTERVAEAVAPQGAELPSH